ncbi:hypothetical protein O181_019227 [Austropuccinia psidii MF-1]|uniref:Uncharacterized protein n=1 Tax=Austropuccinia psidii MF-1 TaxID=1389203 RepID=A0A9Q3C9A9_9BASI|nr:hypothetical protein [Austropuccinia psidii MF-1]
MWAQLDDKSTSLISPATTESERQLFDREMYRTYQWLGHISRVETITPTEQELQGYGWALFHCYQTTPGKKADQKQPE